MTAADLDRELVTFAAQAMRAAGDKRFMNFWYALEGSICLELGSHRGAITSYWEPLARMDDALQCAVRLRLHLGIEDCTASAWHKDSFGIFCTEMFVDGNDDIATCRAIVRAAAEVGRAIR